MTVGSANFNNYGDYGVNPLKTGTQGAKQTDKSTSTDAASVKEKAQQLASGLEGSGSLGTVSLDKLNATAGANPVKATNKSTTVETPATGASAISALFDDNQIANEILSTGDNSELSFANQSLLLAANRSGAGTLGAEDVLNGNSETEEANKLLVGSF